MFKSYDSQWFWEVCVWKMQENYGFIFCLFLLFLMQWKKELTCESVLSDTGSFLQEKSEKRTSKQYVKNVGLIWLSQLFYLIFYIFLVQLNTLGFFDINHSGIEWVECFEDLRPFSNKCFGYCSPNKFFWTGTST